MTVSPATQANVELLAQRVHDCYCQPSTSGPAPLGLQDGLIEATAVIVGVPTKAVLRAMRKAGHPYQQDRATFGTRVAALLADPGADQPT